MTLMVTGDDVDGHGNRGAAFTCSAEGDHADGVRAYADRLPALRDAETGRSRRVWLGQGGDDGVIHQHLDPINIGSSVGDGCLHIDINAFQEGGVWQRRGDADDRRAADGFRLTNAIGL